MDEHRELFNEELNSILKKNSHVISKKELLLVGDYLQNKKVSVSYALKNKIKRNKFQIADFAFDNKHSIT